MGMDLDEGLKAMTDWKTESEPTDANIRIGDVFTIIAPRSKWAVWRDRIIGLRWDVPITEQRSYTCTAPTSTT